jgi:hypothetical protein
LAKTKNTPAIEERVNRIKVTGFRSFVSRASTCDTVFFQLCHSLYFLGFSPFQFLKLIGFEPEAVWVSTGLIPDTV